MASSKIKVDTVPYPWYPPALLSNSMYRSGLCAEHLGDMFFVSQGIVRGSVVNIGNPSSMAYDGRAALWGSPRSNASSEAHPIQPSSILPPLSQLVQRAEDGGLLLRVGALAITLSTDAGFKAVNLYRSI